jgi:hypothetical protein
VSVLVKFTADDLPVLGGCLHLSVDTAETPFDDPKLAQLKRITKAIRDCERLKAQARARREATADSDEECV